MLTFLLLSSLLLIGIFGQNDNSELYQYVFEQVDPLFEYTDLNYRFEGTTQHGVYTAHVINMTSGSFLNSSIVNHVIWWHHIVIIIPNPLSGPPASTTKTFYWTACADAGTNNHPSDMPGPIDADVLIAAEISTQSNLIGFVIYTNPNQPIVWADDPAQKERKNDALLSYSIHESMFYNYTPLFFAMVRANARAVDALTDICKKKFNWDLQEFVAGGASKWGWLTWLWSAVDDRVVAFVPVVFDMLNWVQNAHHQYQSYGGWTFAFEDYWEEGITAYLDSQMEYDLMQLIDPYVFRDNYKGKPKFVLHNGRDEFFMPDDTWYWWNDMPEPKWTLLVGNTEHAGITGLMETLPAVATWTYAILMDDKKSIIPFVNWTLHHSNYSINAYTKMLPMSARVWWTESCRDCNDRRDFRALSLDNPCSGPTVNGDKCYNVNSIWEEIEITTNYTMDNDMYVWQWSMDGNVLPRRGGSFKSFFIDFKFNVSDDGGDSGGLQWPFDQYGIFEFSTECMISNNTFPFPDCSGLECNGTLV